MLLGVLFFLSKNARPGVRCVLGGFFAIALIWILAFSNPAGYSSFVGVQSLVCLIAAVCSALPPILAVRRRPEKQWWVWAGTILLTVLIFLAPGYASTWWPVAWACLLYYSLDNQSKPALSQSPPQPLPPRLSPQAIR